MGVAIPFFRVDESLCRKDGICAKVCPERIIKGAVGEVPSVGEKFLGRCISCGQCMAFCPTRACVAPGVDPDDGRALRPEVYPTPEQVEELVFARRSIRNFKDATVPREVLFRILDAVRFAPTGKNRQPLRWIVTEGREKSRSLLELIIDWLRGLPETDPAMAERIHAAGVARAWDKGMDILSRNAAHIIIVVGRDTYQDGLDALVNLSYCELLAQAHGVGCCWSGYLTRAFRHPSAGPVREFLGLLPGEAAFSALIAGVPQFRAVSRPPRNPVRVTWK